MADLDLTECYHARYANPFTVGVELQSNGRAPAGRIQRKEYDDEIHGRRMRFLRFTNAQCASAYNVARALCDIYGMRASFPTDDRGKVLRSVMPASKVAQWNGLLGHFHLTREKVDPSPHLLDELQFVLTS